VSGDVAAGPLFTGEGELSRAMRARDWSQTPLGDPATWPSALRNTVRILLTSRFPMWAGWGPDLHFFYNDAYFRDTLQTKHPWALGRPASEVWAEIWDDISPRVHTVLDTGQATWDDARSARSTRKRSSSSRRTWARPSRPSAWPIRPITRTSAAG
jgi:hypothetical protein